jgi:hypothetical protein
MMSFDRVKDVVTVPQAPASLELCRRLLMSWMHQSPPSACTYLMDKPFPMISHLQSLDVTLRHLQDCPLSVICASRLRHEIMQLLINRFHRSNESQ